MSTDWTISFIYEHRTVITTFVLVTVFGTGLTYFWNLQLKRRERELKSTEDFQNLYGEFFAVWKTWNFYIENRTLLSLPETTRWDLYNRIAIAEGKNEAILLSIAIRFSNKKHILTVLGRYRQFYQQLRENIRANSGLAWGSDSVALYVQFKELNSIISHIIQSGRAPHPELSARIVSAWKYVTSNKHEEFWIKEALIK